MKLAPEWPEQPIDERLHHCLKMLWLRDLVTLTEMERIRHDINEKTSAPAADSLGIESLCNTCKQADVSCPIYPQITKTCVEYRE